MSTLWRMDGDKCHFENEAVTGHYRVTGEYQGMRSLVHRASGVQIAAGERLPGLVAPYRVFGNGRRFSDVRDRRAEEEILSNALRRTYPADAQNPFDITATYAWNAEVLDVNVAVKPHEDIAGFELGVASYLAAGFRAFVSRQSNVWGEQTSTIVPVDANPMTDVYALFPRNESAMKTIFDGRWDLPPYPVRYAVPAYFAQALAYRRHVQTGVTALGLGDPDECYAICIPVNNPPEDPSPANGYQAIYFYLFGRDVRCGEPVNARLRWVIGQDLSNAEVLARWDSFAGRT